MTQKRDPFKTNAIIAINNRWYHLKYHHIDQTREDLIERVSFNKVRIASTFEGTENNIKTFLFHALMNNKEDIRNWLFYGKRALLYVRYDFSNAPVFNGITPCVGGLTYDGERFHNSKNAIIILEKLSKNTFGIRTAYAE